ncbi:hypothetical protein BDQ12DRAFT_728498 [Crucibulum laeve]|uniref:Aminotransferase class I/classII domain-containing protein n=1 Tax=Crucibulum laeve TaxID=68775 RepID=A0A5C3LHS3_9AGAR|nr:hypothetical protein BDQ12DRAFT_728498 [Crucibulum laeve]
MVLSCIIPISASPLRGLLDPDHVFLGVASDQATNTNTLVRICVTRECKKILIAPPTYGMHSLCAQVNNMAAVTVSPKFSGDTGERGEKARFSLHVDEVRVSSHFYLSPSHNPNYPASFS